MQNVHNGAFLVKIVSGRNALTLFAKKKVRLRSLRPLAPILVSFHYYATLVFFIHFYSEWGK